MIDKLNVEANVEDLNEPIELLDDNALSSMLVSQGIGMQRTMQSQSSRKQRNELANANEFIKGFGEVAKTIFTEMHDDIDEKISKFADKFVPNEEGIARDLNLELKKLGIPLI